MCFSSGVTTAVDAGSTGCDTFSANILFMDQSKLTIRAYLNVCSTGLDSLPQEMEDVDPAHFDEGKIAAAFQMYGPILQGLKLRTSRAVVKELGYAPLRRTLELAGKLGVSVMVHCTDPPGEMDELLSILRPGDVLTHIPLHHGLDGHEVFVGNKRFMCAFHFDPLCFILRLHNAHLVVRCTALALDKNTDINFVGENALDCFVSPFRGVACLEDGIKLYPHRMLILHRGKNAHLIQPRGNAPNGEAVLIHGKNHLHILADGLVNNELVFVFRRFLVAIGSKRPYKLAVLLLDFQAGTDFHGNVLAIGVVCLYSKNLKLFCKYAKDTVAYFECFRYNYNVFLYPRRISENKEHRHENKL